MRPGRFKIVMDLRCASKNVPTASWEAPGRALGIPRDTPGTFRGPFCADFLMIFEDNFRMKVITSIRFVRFFVDLVASLRDSD